MKFTIYRVGQFLPILEFDDAFEACYECIRMEQKTGLKYEVVVTEAAGASKERT